MLHDGWLWGILGVLIIAVALLVATVFLSPNARLRRRLRKTRGQIVSKAKGQRPTVKFSVKPPRK